MAWTTPATFASGQLVTPTDLNAQVRDNQDVIKTQIADDGTLEPDREIVLPLTAAELSATVPPAVLTANSITHLAFDDAVFERFYFRFRMPAHYAGETLTLRFAYSMASAATGTVRWTAAMWAITPGDAADVDTVDQDANNATTFTVPSTAGHMAEESITLTNDDGLAGGDLVRLRLGRFGSADTATGDAELRALSLTW